jgi:peroxiredoxin
MGSTPMALNMIMAPPRCTGEEAGGDARDLWFGDAHVAIRNAIIVDRIQSPVNALKEGDKAPEFTATTNTGEQLSLSDLKGKPVVLYFYPKDDTPGCTKQACGIRDAYADFRKAGAVVLGVSPDPVKSHVKFINKFELPFTLLADGEARNARRGSAHRIEGIVSR